MTPDFDDLVGTDLEPDERERLLRAHELLLAAGPPPELPRSLAQPPRPRSGDVVRLSDRRRRAALGVLAAALAAALFGIGYAVGHGGNGSSFAARRVIPLHATSAAPRGAVASIALGHRDESGNWQMLVRVTNLKKLPEGAYYSLWLARDGRAIAPCGSFVVGNAATTQVRFTVYYELKRFDGWVLTYQPKGHHEPGRVLLRSV